MDQQASEIGIEAGPVLVYIPAENLGQVWPLIEHHVPTVIERSGGRITLESLAKRLAAREQHLWTVWDGNQIKAVIGVTIGQASSGLVVATINYAAGADSGSWIHLMGELEDACRDAGCQKIEMWARKGWARKLPDYKMTHILLEKDL